MNLSEKIEVRLAEKQNALFDFRPLFMDKNDDKMKLKNTKRMMLNR